MYYVLKSIKNYWHNQGMWVQKESIETTFFVWQDEAC